MRDASAIERRVSKYVCRRYLIFLVFGSVYVSSAMAIDLAPLWDFNQPELSEQRFRAALAGASPDDALILQTQIARTYGLRRDFAGAQQILKSIEPQVATASHRSSRAL